MANDIRPKLVLGNRIDGSSPVRGKMRMFRYGERWLSSYEYDTLDLTQLGGTHQSEHHEVDEVDRFFDRTASDNMFGGRNDPRMTTGAVMFATMDDDDEYTGKYFRRPSTDDMVTGVDDGYRTWGAQTPEQESVGLSFRLRQMDGGADAYFDNARFQVSNILWEFSPDGGRSKWYQLYELPNKPRCRITLPEQTVQLRARAVSNNPEEWVQSMAIRPLVDYQNRDVQAFSWAADAEIDDFGYVTWSKAAGGYGDTVYIVSAETYPPISVQMVAHADSEIEPEPFQFSASSSNLLYDAHKPLLKPITAQFSVRFRYRDSGGDHGYVTISKKVLVDTSYGATPSDTMLDRDDGDQSVTVSDSATGAVIVITLHPAELGFVGSSNPSNTYYNYTPDTVYFEFSPPTAEWYEDEVHYEYSLDVLDGGPGSVEPQETELARTRSTSFSPDDSQEYADFLDVYGVGSVVMGVEAVDALNGSISSSVSGGVESDALKLLVSAYAMTPGYDSHLPVSYSLKIGDVANAEVRMVNMTKYDMSSATVSCALGGSYTPEDTSILSRVNLPAWEARPYGANGGSRFYHQVTEADMYTANSSRTMDAHLDSTATIRELSTSVTTSYPLLFNIAEPLIVYPYGVSILDDGSYVEWDGETPIVEGDQVRVHYDIYNNSGASIDEVRAVRTAGQTQQALLYGPSELSYATRVTAYEDVTVTAAMSYYGMLYAGLRQFRTLCKQGSYATRTYSQDVSIPVLEPSYSVDFAPATENLVNIQANGRIKFKLIQSGDYAGYYEGDSSDVLYQKIPFEAIKQGVARGVQRIYMNFASAVGGTGVSGYAAEYVDWSPDRIRLEVRLYHPPSSDQKTAEMDVLPVTDSVSGDTISRFILYMTAQEMAEYIGEVAPSSPGAELVGNFEGRYYSGGPYVENGSLFYPLGTTEITNTGGAILKPKSEPMRLKMEKSSDSSVTVVFYYSSNMPSVYNSTIPANSSLTIDADSDIVSTQTCPYPPSSNLQSYNNSFNVDTVFSSGAVNVVVYSSTLYATHYLVATNYSSSQYYTVESEGQLVSAHVCEVPTVHKGFMSRPSSLQDTAYVQVNGEGTQYSANGAVFTFSDGDTLKLVVMGHHGGGEIYIDGTRVAQSSYNTCVYTFTPPSHNVGVAVDSGALSKMYITTWGADSHPFE